MGQTNREKRKAAKKKAREKSNKTIEYGSIHVHAEEKHPEGCNCMADNAPRIWADYAQRLRESTEEELEEWYRYVDELLASNKRDGLPDCDDVFGIPKDHFDAMSDEFRRDLYEAATDTSMSRIDRFKCVVVLAHYSGLCIGMNLRYLEIGDA